MAKRPASKAGDCVRCNHISVCETAQYISAISAKVLELFVDSRPYLRSSGDPMAETEAALWAIVGSRCEQFSGE